MILSMTIVQKQMLMLLIRDSVPMLLARILMVVRTVMQIFKARVLIWKKLMLITSMLIGKTLNVYLIARMPKWKGCLCRCWYK